jgi:hypothetical protein
VLGLWTTRVGWRNHDRVADAVWHLAPHDLSIGLEILGQLPEPRAAVAEPRGDGLVAILGDRPFLVVEVSERRRRHFREVRLICGDGTAILGDSYADQLVLVRGRGPASPEVERLPISTEMPLLRELRAFVEHLEGGPAPRSAVHEGVAVVEAIAGLRRLAGPGVEP